MANPQKQIWFGFKQPLVGEKRYVTTQIRAAEETKSNPHKLNWYEVWGRMLESK